MVDTVIAAVWHTEIKVLNLNEKIVFTGFDKTIYTLVMSFPSRFCFVLDMNRHHSFFRNLTPYSSITLPPMKRAPGYLDSGQNLSCRGPHSFSKSRTTFLTDGSLSSLETITPRTCTIKGNVTFDRRTLSRFCYFVEEKKNKQFGSCIQNMSTTR